MLTSSSPIQDTEHTSFLSILSKPALSTLVFEVSTSPSDTESPIWCCQQPKLNVHFKCPRPYSVVLWPYLVIKNNSYLLSLFISYLIDTGKHQKAVRPKKKWELISNSVDSTEAGYFVCLIAWKKIVSNKTKQISILLYSLWIKILNNLTWGSSCTITKSFLEKLRKCMCDRHAELV